MTIRLSAGFAVSVALLFVTPTPGAAEPNKALYELQERCAQPLHRKRSSTNRSRETLRLGLRTHGWRTRVLRTHVADEINPLDQLH